MKHQQVKVDYWEMVKTSSTYLCLVVSGWILFKLVHAVFILPGYLKKIQASEFEKVYAKMEEKCKSSENDDEEEKEKDESSLDEEPKKQK
uniref:CSON000752 protein n=1 Tax=Culicoides sonorensis TaxID=179676 RepID=A0A336M2L1_CULSO